MSNFNEWSKKIEELSFREKVQFVKGVNDMLRGNDINFEVSKIAWYGYLKEDESYKVCAGDNDYYVYLWKHAWGDPFYIGCGKGDRWTTKSPRCNDFYLHLDQADAVVYKVLDGVDSHTARIFEKYVTVNLVEGGYTLANGDNNTEYMTEAARVRRIESCEEIDRHELAPKVQNAVLSILNDRPRCDYRGTDEFIMRNGTDYFSSRFMKKREMGR